MQTATKGNTTWTYTYNADGLRTGKSNGSAVYTYTWNENRQLQSMTWDYGYAVFSYDVNGMPYSVKNYDAILDVERTYLYITSLQGDVLSIIDASSGATAVTYTYDAWGRLISKSGTSSDYASIYEYNPLTYRGYIYDSETGFYYLQSRYYDPTVGRFLNADDVRYLGIGSVSSGWNLYAYCYNSPTNYSDPSGNVAVVDDIFFGLFSIVLAALALSTPKQLPTQGSTVVLPQPGSSTVLPLPNIPYFELKTKKQCIPNTSEVVDVPKSIFPSKAYNYWIPMKKGDEISSGCGLTYSQAREWVTSGGDLVCVDQGAAYAIVKFFPSYTLEKPHKDRYLWHYHLNRNHKNHIWFYGAPSYLYR